jgi:glucokinase
VEDDGLGVRVVVENDADAAALGEATWGSGRGAPSLLYVTISTGIGAGHVRDGRLVRDSRGEHAEYGHHVIEADGPPCYCGSRGCWEAMASGTAIARRYDDLTGGNPRGLSVAGILADDDPISIRVRREAARYLGIGLANLITILRPDVVALGGGVVESWDAVSDDVAESVARHSRYVSIDDIIITPARLRPHTALVGAAAAYLRRDEEPWT